MWTQVIYAIEENLWQNWRFWLQRSQMCPTRTTLRRRPPPSFFSSCNHCGWFPPLDAITIARSTLSICHFRSFSKNFFMCSCQRTKITPFTNQVREKQHTGNHSYYYCSPHLSLDAWSPISLILIPKTHPNQIIWPVVRQIARFYSMSVL